MTMYPFSSFLFAFFLVFVSLSCLYIIIIYHFDFTLHGIKNIYVSLFVSLNTVTVPTAAKARAALSFLFLSLPLPLLLAQV